MPVILSRTRIGRAEARRSMRRPRSDNGTSFDSGALHPAQDFGLGWCVDPAEVARW